MRVALTNSTIFADIIDRHDFVYSTRVPCWAKKMVAVDGFESSPVFSQIHDVLSASQTDRESAMKKVKAVFQFEVKVYLDFNL
jgi:hypothetical protein